MGKGIRRPSLPAIRHEVPGVRVDVERLTQYQHLLHEPARDTLPSGYLHALAFPVAMSVMTEENFPLPLLGMIHLKNYVEHRRPVQFNEPLDIAAWAENLRGHRAGTQVEMVAEVSAAGETVWRGVSTYLAKGIYLPSLDGPHASTPPPDFKPPPPTANWRLGLETGRSYAAVSGDFNPIHLSALSAKVLGMRRSLAHGMYLGARALNYVGSDAADSFSWEVEFAAPVFLPATVAIAVDDNTDAREQWQSSSFTAWNPHTARKHFSGRVAAL